MQPVIFVAVQTGVGANGGIESVSQIIARLQRHRPIILTDRESSRTDNWREAGIETHFMPQTVSRGTARRPWNAIASYWRYARELTRLVNRSGAKVIHANDPASMQLAILPAKLTGAKLVFNIRDTLDPDRSPPTIRYRTLFRAADHVLYLSRDMASRWAAVVPRAKVPFSVTYSVVNPDVFAPAAPVARDAPQVVLLSGLISAKKGQLEFVRHVSPLLAQHGIATWLTGDFDARRNPYMAACAEAAVPLGELVQFLGYRTDVAELMARSSVIAVPSRHEGLVRAMIEAMSCARPVVSFDVSSAREMLEDESNGAGVVVRSGDYQAMADAIIRYCRNPELAAAAGEKGRMIARRLFSPHSVVERYERVYERLIEAAAATA